VYLEVMTPISISWCVLAIVSLSPVVLAGDGVTLRDGTPNPKYSGLYAWYDGTNGVNGAQGHAQDGALVISWNDSSINGRHLTRTTLGSQPRYSLDAGAGVPGVEFTDDFIWASSGEYGSLSGPRTFFLVTRPDLADGGYVMDSSSIAGRSALFTGQDSMPEQWVGYAGGSNVFSGGEVAIGEVSIVTLIFNADGTQDIQVNGEDTGSSSGTPESQAGIILGSRYNVENRLSGGISEAVVYAEALSETDREAVMAYLLIKYGFEGDACIGDLNIDGYVDGADMGLLLAGWSTNGAGDLNGDGVVDGADVGLMLAYWGPCPADPCEGIDCDDSDPCTTDTCVDGRCIHTPIEGCFPGCGDPASGSCQEDNGTPGCDDPSCCSFVCEIDVFCCDVAWDASCVAQAKNCP
jgi:hypothetical protein